MIRTIQLYIENERVDLFGDESINITESIRNAKDISKVFTTFSQQFTVPASKTNNRIFKHFYNYDIDSPYDFDARKKTAARIEINYLPFKSGRIKLDGVDLRDNKPYTYRITFYGSIVDLKDLVGEDKLPNLSAFSSVQLDYDISNLISNLTQNATADYALAMITAGQRLYYDSEVGSQGSGNIHYDGTTAQGLKPQQLKYAVKLSKILEAIESQYNEPGREIIFADNSFFNPSQANDLDELYMWLHRKNDTVEITAGTETKVPYTSTFNDGNYFYIDVSGDLIIVEDPSVDETLRFTASATSTARYDLVIKKNGETIKAYEGVTGTISPTFSTGVYTIGDEFAAYIRTYEENVTFSGLRWQAFNGSSGAKYVDSYQTTYSRSYAFNVSENIPEIKVIDFLSGLFKMFNLVAYVNDDGEIVTQTLDEFYRKGGRYDISQYIDVSKSSVDSALPFKEIFFKYKDTKTILAEQHYQEISTVEWGGLEYTSDTDLSGDIYKVEPPFHHAKYEKLLDGSNTNFSTNVQVGYFVTDNEEAYLGDPLIFYIVPQATAIQIGYTKDGNLINSPISVGTNVNMPSNSKSFNAATSEENINFNAELNEFTGTAFEDTLFKRYYEKYIVSVFNRRNRLTKVTAYLPVKILREIELNDTITINGRNYIINSMQVDINSGKTEFELLNKYNVNAIWEQVEDTWSSITDNWIDV